MMGRFTRTNEVDVVADQQGAGYAEARDAFLHLTDGTGPDDPPSS